MKVSISVGSAYYNGDNWEDLVEYVCAADRLGVDSVWSAEAWGMEAVASLGYLAARTQHIGLGTGIMQISARTPATTAMSALALDRLSNGRFRLGLGGMGSARTNFYNAAFTRAGFGDVAAEVQRLWVAGDKPGAVAAVPDDMVLAAYSIGTADMVSARVRALAAAGIDAVRLGPVGKTSAEQIAHLEMAIDLVRSATATTA